jgi:hypothetical protein
MSAVLNLSALSTLAAAIAAEAVDPNEARLLGYARARALAGLRVAREAARSSEARASGVHKVSRGEND